MSKANQPIPAGRENLIPHLVCARCAEAIEFYKKAFGAEEIFSMPAPDGRIMHAEIRIGSSVVFLADDFPEYCGGMSQTPTALKGTPVTMHRYVANCDAAIKRAQLYVEAGADKTATGSYVLSYRWEGGGLLGGRSLRLISLGH